MFPGSTALQSLDVTYLHHNPPRVISIDADVKKNFRVGHDEKHRRMLYYQSDPVTERSLQNAAVHREAGHAR